MNETARISVLPNELVAAEMVPLGPGEQSAEYEGQNEIDDGRSCYVTTSAQRAMLMMITLD